jgi:hypothetical protein
MSGLDGGRLSIGKERREDERRGEEKKHLYSSIDFKLLRYRDTL